MKGNDHGKIDQDLPVCRFASSRAVRDLLSKPCGSQLRRRFEGAIPRCLNGADGCVVPSDVTRNGDEGLNTDVFMYCDNSSANLSNTSHAFLDLFQFCGAFTERESEPVYE